MIDTSTPRTFGALLLAAAARWPDREAVVFHPAQQVDGRRTYAALAAGAQERAHRLQQAGIRRGDHVALLLHNSPRCIEWLGALSLLDAVAVPLNPRYRAKELDFLLRDSAAVALISGEDATLAALERIAVPAGAGGPAQSPAALLMYTSGTTADPKGCLVSHATWLAAAQALADNYALQASDRLWNPLPMCHMAALHPFAACATVGATFVSMTRFEPALALQQLVSEQIDVLYAAFPTILADLVNAPGFAAADLARIRRINCVAPAGTLRTLQAALPAARLTSVYGLTEAGGVVAYGRAEESLEIRTSTCGQPFAGIQLRIVDAVGAVLPTGHTGEIQLQGWCVFDGYWQQPAATAAVLTAAGWLHTGDLGSLDSSGRLQFHGRLKDMLKVGGENVSAAEVESVLARHPAVKLAQVVGMPDARLGEAAAAFVELRPDTATTADELIGHCRAHLASFKVPRQVRFVTEWPMSATKIQKYQLREWLSVAP